MVLISTKTEESHNPEEIKRVSDLSLLLMILIPFVVIVPVIPTNFGFRSVVVLFIVFLYAIGIYCMRVDRKRFLTGCILALISIELFFVSLWQAASILFILGEVIFLIFLIYLVQHLVTDYINSHGSFKQIISYTIILALLGGMACGTGLHLAGFVNRTGITDLSSLHSSFGRAITSGILLILRGGDITVSSPLSGIIIMIGTLSGFLLLIVSIGKIVVLFERIRIKEEEIR